jgi:uncharacterized protein (TIGR02147 family)
VIHTDFVEFFKDAFELRRRRNPQYSMRAFARDLRLSPSRLHHILEGRIGLSLAAATEIATRLSLNDEDRDLFLTLVEAKHARAKYQKGLAQDRLRSLTEIPQHPLEASRFSLISRWYHMATFVLVDVEGFRFESEWIAQRLGITVDEAQTAMDDLLDHGFLKFEDGICRRTDNHLTFHADKSNADIKAYNRQLLSKAAEAISDVPVEDRDLSASVLSIRRADLDLAKDEIAKFRKQLSKKLVDRAGAFDRVYCLSLQIFPLDRT